MTKPKDVFLKALELSDKYDHVKGRYYQTDKDGKIIGCCILGLLMLAKELLGASKFSPTQELEAILDQSPSIWNDLVTTNKDSVVRLLHAGISKCEI